MNKNLVVILFLLVVAILIAAVVYYQKEYTPKYEWGESYTKDNAQPYGMKLFYTIIKKQNKTVTLIKDQSYQELDTNKTNSNFIMMAHNLNLDSAEASIILKYVEKGNNAFICSNVAPLELSRTFVPATDSIDGYEEYYDSIISVNFGKTNVPYPQKIKFHYQNLKDTIKNNWCGYRWNYFFDTLTYYDFKAISTIDDTIVNSYYIQHGKGKLIFHCNPVLFTNYNLLQKDGFAHVNNILSYFKNGSIYWDDPASDNTYTGKSAQGNPLKFLFSDYRLRWGWYLFIITIFLYLIFRSKREQRIIPILPKNQNTSIEYTKAIGTLYYQKGGHNNIASEMYILFLSDVRSRYNIFTDMEEKDLITEISIRSGIKALEIADLFNQFNTIKSNPNTNSKELIELYNSIENYHKNRK
jgi:hypothetical protein